MCSKLSTVPNSKLSASIKRSGGGGRGEEGRGSILGISMQMNGPGFQLHSGFQPPPAFSAPSHARLGGFREWRRGRTRVRELRLLVLWSGTSQWASLSLSVKQFSRCVRRRWQHLSREVRIRGSLRGT